MNDKERIIELIHNVTVKITTKTKTGNISGTGVIYPTEHPKYAYIFTALHNLLGKRKSKKEYELEKSNIQSIIIEHKEEEEGKETNLKIDLPTEIDDLLICHQQSDFAILLIDKTKENPFINIVKKTPTYYLLKKKKNNLKNLIALGYPNFTKGKLWGCKAEGATEKYNYDYAIKISENIHGDEALDEIGGFSGSGFFYEKAEILIGFARRLINETGKTDRILVRRIDDLPIKKLLNEKNLDLEIPLYKSSHKTFYKDDDYENVRIEGIEYNLNKAINRIKNDMQDDWFQDPLLFEDILNPKFLYQKLKNNHKRNWQYKPSKSLLFSIPKKGFTARYAMETNLVDRVVYQMLVDYIIYDFDEIIENNVYSFRFDTRNTNNLFVNSIEQWKKFTYQLELSVEQKKENVFFVATDITHFFDSINIELLIQILNKCNNIYIKHTDKDKKEKYVKTIFTLKKILTEWSVNKSGIGIPQNREPSQFLANIYLCEVDKAMINYGYEYYRYADDFRIICKNKLEAQKALKDLTNLLRSIRLNLNSGKTSILNYKSNRSEIIKFFPFHDIKLEQITSLLNAKKIRDVQIAVNMVVDLYKETIERIKYNEENKKNEIITELKRNKNKLLVRSENEETIKFQDTTFSQLETSIDKLLTASGLERAFDIDIIDRHLKFCISRLQQFAREPFLRNVLGSFLDNVAQYCANQLIEQPWYSDMYLKYLKALPKEKINQDIIKRLKELLLCPDKNLYEWQAYHVWLLLTKQEIYDKKLITYAFNTIDNPNPNNKPNTAGAFLYLATIKGAFSISQIKNAIDENKFNDFFTQRCAIIATKKFTSNDFDESDIQECLKKAHEFIHNNSKIDYYVKPLPELDTKSIMRDISEQIISL